MARTWSREQQWRGALPLEDALEIVARAEDLMKGLPTGYGETDCFAVLTNPSATIRTKDGVQAFQGELESEAGGDLKHANLTVYSSEEVGTFDLVVQINLYRFPTGPIAEAKVNGVDRTAVEGVYAQLAELTERRLKAVEQRRREREEQERAREEQERASHHVSVSDPPTVEVSATPWWHNPWTVQIIGGIIAGVLVAVIIAILLG
jgi:hypothetical protein